MTALYGLVVCGGQSTRMGTDKGLLDYHGKPQRYYLMELLQPYCEQVFISCTSTQATGIPAGYGVITDADPYTGTGPMAALMSAFQQYPESAFLCLGCDYPLIGPREIEALIQSRSLKRPATSFYNLLTKMEEPLLAIYEKEAYPLLLEQFREKKYSLRKFLREHSATQVLPASSDIITSIDTPALYRQVTGLIRQSNLPGDPA